MISSVFLKKEKKMLNFNYVNAYFGVCLICWVISLIATVLIIAIKPLRKWFIGICYRWGKTYGEELMELASEDFPELFKEENKAEEDDDLPEFEFDDEEFEDENL